ncbi:MAG: hypothetical protein KAS93_08090 [Gammaproteobacteria bacterium]|nr:hypothetical protein [Gammaproteobacteria bacterium]
MHEPTWRDVKNVIAESIKYNTEICTNPLTTETERVIAASEIQAFETILDLQSKEPGIDHE